MSRIGKKPITIPENVEVEINGQKVTVKGPEGSLEMGVRSELEVKKEDNKIIINPISDDKQTPALWGTTRARLANMVKGVQDKFEKKLEIRGIGYKARQEGDKLILEVGLSHPVEMKKPEGIELEVEKDKIKVSGINKEEVGQFAAKIRNVKPPEPYKGKGIRYEGEHVERKEGKKAVGTLEE